MSYEDDPLTAEGERLREIAAHGSETFARWDFVPCARSHVPGALCILPDGHGRQPHPMDLEYQDVGEGPVQVDLGSSDPLLVGGFAIRAAVMPVDAAGVERHYPTLIFDFTLARGVRLQPIVLIMEEDDLANVGRLIGNAGHGAIEAARKAEGRDPKTGRRTS